MTVLSRSNIGVARLRRDREDSLTEPEPEPRRRRLRLAPDPPSTPDAREAVARRRRREAGAPQDEAMYSCRCGFQFAASVSTSVDCPHCGDAQAW